jgi:RNA polymerase sigma-70 factor (ECF subfamily)
VNIQSTNRTATTSDEVLMAQLASGKKEAFELLYERYFDKLVWFASGFLQQTEQAEDVVQEVFLQIIRSPHQFDSQRKFSTWVYTLTGNACRTMLKTDRNRERLLEQEVIPFVAIHDQVYQHSQHDYALLKKNIALAFGQLSDKEKSLFVLRFEEELSLSAISEILSLPEGSVKSGIYYLLKKISTSLKLRV